MNFHMTAFQVTENSYHSVLILSRGEYTQFFHLFSIKRFGFRFPDLWSPLSASYGMCPNTSISVLSQVNDGPHRTKAKYTVRCSEHPSDSHLLRAFGVAVVLRVWKKLSKRK